MIRCCLCRERYVDTGDVVERTDLPGTGWRCTDREACADRVKAIVSAHRAWAEI